MNCPNCGKPVPDDQMVCGRCGKRLRYPDDLDREFVYSVRGLPERKKPVFKRIIIVLVAAVVICGAIVGLMIYMQRQSGGSSETQPQTTAVQETTVQETTAPATTAPQETAATKSADAAAEKKLTNYLKRSNLYENLVSEADDDMSVNLSVEGNRVVAKYLIPIDSTEEEQAEYVGTLNDFFLSLCSRLDGDAFDLKNNSGVPNAQLEIVAVDQNGVSLFSDVVD